MLKKELLSLPLLESKISTILRILKFVFWLSTMMNFISLLFVIFSTTKYYYHFHNASFLDVLLALILYAAFYVILFLAFPALFLLLMCYFLFKLKFKKNLQIKKHIKLIILNILILLAIFLVVVVNKS